MVSLGFWLQLYWNFENIQCSAVNTVFRQWVLLFSMYFPILSIFLLLNIYWNSTFVTFFRDNFLSIRWSDMFWVFDIFLLRLLGIVECSLICIECTDAYRLMYIYTGIVINYLYFDCNLWYHFVQIYHHCVSILLVCICGMQCKCIPDPCFWS